MNKLTTTVLLLFLAKPGFPQILSAAANCQTANITQTPSSQLTQTTPGGETALMFAAANGCLEGVKILIAEGENVNAISLTYDTALTFSEMNNHPDIATYLRAHGALDYDPKPLPEKPDQAIALPAKEIAAIVEKLARENQDDSWRRNNQWIAYKYQDKERTGELRIRGAGPQARNGAVEAIGQICAGKNVGLVPGKEPPDDGRFSIENESLKNQVLTLEFRCLY